MDLTTIMATYRWPKKGDRLLRASNDWDNCVEFSVNPLSRHVHIWSGYVRAGAALVEQCERAPLDRHSLIYPILFDYRHALELAMKWIIDTYGRYVDVRLNEDERDHDLWHLWGYCKQVITALGSAGEKDNALRAVEQIVKDFHDLDKSSMAFRYPTKKDGATIRLPDTSINLQNIKEVMESVDHFFTGVDGDLDANSSAMDWN